MSPPENGPTPSSLEARLRLSETLLDVARTLGATLDLTETMRRVARSAARALGADMVGAYLHDRDRGHLWPVAGYRVPPELRDVFRQSPFPAAGHRFVEEAQERGAPVWSDDARGDPRITVEAKARFPHQSVLFAPMLAADGLVGGFVMIWWSERRRFTTEDVALADGIARQAVLAVASARLYAESERRAREGNVFGELTRTISASLDLDEVLRELVRAAKTLCGADNAQIALREPGTERIVTRHHVEPPPLEHAPVAFEPGKGLGGKVLVTGEPWRTGDYAADPRFTKDYFDAAVASGIVACLAVPIRVHGRIEGLLFVDNRSPRPFADRDEAMLVRLADHAAAAIQNAQDHRRAGERAEKLQTLIGLTRMITGGLDSGEVCRAVARAAGALLDAALARVWVVEGDRRALRVHGEWSRDARAVSGPDVIAVLPYGTGVVGSIAATGRAEYIPDIRDDSRLVNRGFIADILGFAGVPLVVAGEVGGVLALGFAERRTPGAEERELIELLAGQAAIAVRNAQHFAEIARQREEAVALEAVAREINSSLDRAEVVQRIVDRARRLVGADAAHLAVVDAALGTATVAAASGFRTAGPRSLEIVPGRGLAGRALESGRSWVTDDCATDRRLTTDYVEVARAEGLVSGASVPLRLGERVLGTLTVFNRAPSPFGDRHVAVLERLAEQAAIALENARLLSEVRTHQARLETLLDLTRQMSEITPVASVFESIARGCAALLASPSVSFRLVEGEDLVVAGWWGETAEPARRPRLRIGESLPGIVAATGEVVVVEDPGEDPRVVPEHREILRSQGYRAWLGVPIKLGERLLGVLSVRTKRRRGFSPGDAKILSAFAAQAAVAIENARLFQEAQRAYEELAQAQDHLVQVGKLEAIGRLAGGIAHDFNNLLTIIRGRSQILLHGLPGGDADRAHVELIDQAAKRAASLTQQLLAFSRKQMLQPKVLDLNTVVAGLSPMLDRLIGEHITITTVLDPGLGLASADPAQMEQVLLNLAVNARDAMPDGGVLRFETANVEVASTGARPHPGMPPGRFVRVAVSDTGCGMDAETQRHAFEPFFTTKDVGQGTGLGLATVYGIVKQHGGWITLASEPGRGTALAMLLPRVDAPSGQEASEPEGAEDPRGKETILLVEDEPELLALVSEVLAQRGYSVLAAATPEAAQDLAVSHAGPIDLLLTDVVMPQMNGRQLAERLMSRRPELRVLYMSGYTDDAVVHRGVQTSASAFVAKPFSPDQLARKVREVLDAPGAR